MTAQYVLDTGARLYGLVAKVNRQRFQDLKYELQRNSHLYAK